MAFSSFVERIGGDGADAWTIHYEAKRRAERGEDVIVLSVGDHDFHTPDDVVARAVTSLRSGRTHYTNVEGERDLRERIAAVHHGITGQAVEADNVVVVPGAQCGLFSTLMCVAEAGDEVISPEPRYATYEATIKAGGATIVGVPMRPETGFRLDPADVEAAITPRTRAVVINTPHNPSGAVMSRADVEAIAEICRARDIWLISDEVYAAMTYDAPHVSPAGLPGMADRCAVVSSLSKSHSMTGWRLGWVVGPKDLAGHLYNLMMCMLYGAQPFIQDAAVTALETAPDQFRALYRRRRDLVCAALDAIPGIAYHRPASGMFVMIDIRASGLSSSAFTQGLLDQEGLSLLPADAFGPSARGYVRLSLGADDARLADACRRLARFVAAGGRSRATG